MRKTWLLASIVSLLSFAGAFAAYGQKTSVSSQYVISAKAGGVNYVTGKVSVMHRSGTSGLVVEGDQIGIGDKVTTGEDGRVEVLLNPGSYLRLGSQSTFEFASTDLENLKINLRAGSAIFEVYATNEFRISIKIPQSTVVLNSSGVFRIDVLSDGSGRVAVFKGETDIASAGKKLGSGRVATITSSGLSIAKFDRDTKDPLDIWAKSRAKELTSLNAKLQRNTLRDSLLSSFGDRGWNLYGSFGLWVFDPIRRSSLFLPFGYGWMSPYGWDYSYDLWRCRMPSYVWNQTRQPVSVPTSGGGGASPIDRNARTMEDRRIRTQPPPFQRLEREAARTGAAISPSGDAGTVFGTNGNGEIRPMPRIDTAIPRGESPVFSPSASGSVSAPSRAEGPASMPTKVQPAPVINPNK